MPKVRDSSGTIGTMCLPIFLSRSKSPSSRTKPIVVDISLPGPLLTSLSERLLVVGQARALPSSPVR